jgi:hypothetical protein
LGVHEKVDIKKDQMSEQLKEELLDLLNIYDPIEFRVTPTHKGIELDVLGSTEEKKKDIRDVIEEWVCYGDLSEFLFTSGSYYSYDCEIFGIEANEKEDYRIIDFDINVEIYGPLENEFETTFVEFKDFVISKELEINPQEYGFEKFENELFQVDFFIEEMRSVNRFELFYLYNETRINIILNDQQKSTISDFIVEFAKNKVPQLDLNIPIERKQSWVSIRGESNEITFMITEYFIFKFDEIYN